jgi:hypothetical protein
MQVSPDKIENKRSNIKSYKASDVKIKIEKAVS